MKLTKEQAIEKCFNNCNLIGENVNIYEQIYKFKVLKSLPDTEIESIYEYISKRLGF